jgi:hypothetical protein
MQDASRNLASGGGTTRAIFRALPPLNRPYLYSRNRSPMI